MSNFGFNIFSLMIMLIFPVFLPGINGLHELWSRDEMVRMAGYGEEKLSTVLVTGSVHCDACLHSQHPPRSFPVPGASVVIKCHTGRRTKPFKVRAVADEYGEFTVDLPPHLHAIPHLEKSCLVHALHIPRRSECQPSHAKKHRGLLLSSVRDGMRTYTTGSIKFSHRLQACPKKASPSTRLHNRYGTDQRFEWISSAY